MDSKAIEILAVNAVKNSIVLSDYLTPFIADNDKEPTWDGNIYIYTNKNKKKDELKGRVPVQIKGKESNDFSKNKITFPVEVSDLKNYLSDGGAIFFVVYIGNNGLQKIYYTNLLPIKLRFILFQVKEEQKTKSIELKEFPKDNKCKETIFFNFYEHRLKQASFTSSELLSLDDLYEQGVLKSISTTVSCFEYDISDPHKAFFENDIYLYANIKGSAIPQPLEILPIDFFATQEIQNKVFVNGKLFYNSYLRTRSKDKDVYKFGKSFTIEISKERNSCSINYKTTGTLRARRNDLDFMLNLIEAKCFNLNATFPVLLTDFKLDNFNIEQEKRNLEYYKKMQQVLDLLNVKEDLIIEKMTEKDRYTFDHLIKAFLLKEPVNGLKPDLPSVVKLQISNITLLLSFFPYKREGTYQIYDFFSTNLNIAYKDKNGVMQLTSQYAILKKEDYLEVANIRFDVLLPSYKMFEDNIDILGKANYVLLDLLAAYDESGGKRKELLNTAKAFAEWLIGTNDSLLPYEIKKLNLLQIIKRQRKFEKEELKALLEITENSTMREDILVGAYLLLDNQIAAELHLERMDPLEKETFKAYPIFKFWKGEDKKLK